ncbi:DUF551 domain-containing protein [Citrobacter freundii]|uniref:DUF551 domain-containing protein n=1 Tax=Citrobacter freundii TaxID=546 RepID=UPI001FFDEC71|nr:DUF551 domain-containing protein [Citrobacter freundii]
MTTNSHPANGLVSLDRLHQISEILSKAAAQSDGGNLGYAMADAVKVIDGAIASFGAEPVSISLPVQHWEELCRQNPDMSIGDAIIRAAWWNHCTAMLQAGNYPVNPDGWIPVSERMPDDDDFVYIWPRPDFGIELHVGQYCECHPKGDGWYAQVYEQNYGIEWHPIIVTHWMPLPAAPQQEVKS